MVSLESKTSAVGSVDGRMHRHYSDLNNLNSAAAGTQLDAWAKMSLRQPAQNDGNFAQNRRYIFANTIIQTKN